MRERGQISDKRVCVASCSNHVYDHVPGPAVMTCNYEGWYMDNDYSNCKLDNSTETDEKWLPVIASLQHPSADHTMGTGKWHIWLQWRHMNTIASQISSLTIVYSTVYSGADQRKHQSSASLAFVRGIHRWPVNSPHKGPVTRKMLPFDDVIMSLMHWILEHVVVIKNL